MFSVLGPRDWMKSQGSHSRITAVTVELIVTHIASHMTHHLIKPTGYIEQERLASHLTIVVLGTRVTVKPKCLCMYLDEKFIKNSD